MAPDPTSNPKEGSQITGQGQEALTLSAEPAAAATTLPDNQDDGTGAGPQAVQGTHLEVDVRIFTLANSKFD
jgi:hypothetical protein